MLVNTTYAAPTSNIFKVVIHRTTDHGFGCDIGGMNETIRVGIEFTLIVVQIKLEKKSGRET